MYWRTSCRFACLLSCTVACFASIPSLFAQPVSEKPATNTSTYKEDRTQPSPKITSGDTVLASFPGGLIEWRRYLERNLHYPEAAYTTQTQGLVSVAITITEEGKITDAKALNDPGNGLAAEAVRVVTEGPAWLPATVAGKPVSSSFRQKITFRLGASTSKGAAATFIGSLHRFNQRVVIKTPRRYNGQPVDALIPAYDRPGLNVQISPGRSFYLNPAETMQAFGIVISSEGFVVPEEDSVVYYDNNAKAFDNWGGLRFVGGVQTYALTPLLGTSRYKLAPSKIPIICLDGKEVTVEELQQQNRNQKTLRTSGLVKMQDAPALEKYGQRGQNGVLFVSTKMGYPDNYLFLYEGKEIRPDEVPRSAMESNLSWRVLEGEAARKQYGEKAKFGAVIIQRMKPDSSMPSMVFTKTTQPATFPGGNEALKKYLADSLRYPAAARKNKTEGTVQVSVLLDSTGTVLRINGMNQPGDGLMEEAVRLLRAVPAWIPARQNGRAVAYRAVVPVIFKLDPISYF